MKKSLSASELSRIMDVSAVKTESSFAEVDKIIEAAKKFNFICISTVPTFTPYVAKMMKDYPEVRVGGTVGFPAGSDSTATKVFQTQELMSWGCKEIDMVLNVNNLKSGLYEEVVADIKAVREVCHGALLKVIMEVAVLTDDEIQIASKLIREAGADFVKTGTGWRGVTNMHHVRLIKQAVGDTIELKVAGGVRDLETIMEMYEAGVTRFGIGHASALDILENAAKQ